MPGRVAVMLGRLKRRLAAAVLGMTAAAVPGMLPAFLSVCRGAGMQLSALYSYPIKGIAGRNLTEAELEPRGLRDDRRWLLVDADGRFLSQRELPAMALLNAQPHAEGWHLQAPGQPDHVLRKPAANAARLAVTIWADAVDAALADAASAQWFSAVLGQPVRVVYMDTAAVRPVDPDYAQRGDQVSFADGFPLLVANEASLADLSARVGEPLSMARFRPNLVIRGAEAWAEDSWRRLRIGAVELDLVKPCARCQVTTLDPGSAIAHPRQEPLRTLAQFRKQQGKVMFAVNAIPRHLGRLVLGQHVEVLS